MNLNVPITLADELFDQVIAATGLLDLASGEIHKVQYQNYSAADLGYPWEHEDYDFSCGTLSNDGKDIEFAVHVNQTTGQYTVSATELLEIKVRAAALFSGVPSTELLEGINTKPQRGQAKPGRA